jgi:hypothetical protein
MKQGNAEADIRAGKMRMFASFHPQPPSITLPSPSLSLLVRYAVEASHAQPP